MNEPSSELTRYFEMRAVIPCLLLFHVNHCYLVMEIKKYLDVKSDNGPESYMPPHHYFKFEMEACIGMSREVLKLPSTYFLSVQDLTFAEVSTDLETKNLYSIDKCVPLKDISFTCK